VSVHFLNDRRPWFGTLRGSPMRVRELIDNGTLSFEAAATLWWAIEHGASVFAAAGPSGAGKSILATALLEYLPDDAQAYVTAGAWDRLELPADADGPLYLLINELSYHLPLYLSGVAAQWAFGLLRTGVRMVGTLHARSAAEAVEVMAYESEVPRSELAAPFVLAVISARRTDQGVVRRVVEIGFLPPLSGDLELLVSDLNPTRVSRDTLAAWAGRSKSGVEAEIDRRAAQLAGLEPP
jgi:flagellar protein FlaI